MKISKIELDHFKRFTNLIIDLGENSKKIIVLVGPNGCGKSSIFDAFNQKIIYSLGNKLNLGDSYFSKKQYLELDNEKFDLNDSVKIYDEHGNLLNNINKKKIYIRSAYRFTSKFNIQNIRNVGEVLDDKSRPGVSIDLDTRLQENYERLISGFFDEVYDQEITGKNWVDSNLLKINEILNNILEIKISDLGNPTKNRGQLYFEKGISKNFPYENLSSGEKEVIDLILDLIVKAKEYNDTVFCIDEPELHINTAIQRKLLIEIEKLISDNCQLWIATHSIGFIRALQSPELKDKVQVLNFSGENFDKNVVLKSIELNRINLQKIFETALDDINGLLSPEFIVYCEGKNLPNLMTGEEQGVDAIIYNEIFGKEFPNYFFISSGGCSEIDKHSALAIKILQKAFIDSSILLFKDKDINSDGSLTDDKKRLIELRKNAKLRILKRREIENYLFDFEILKNKYPNLDKSNYDSIVIDVINDDIKKKIQNLKILCSETKSISKDNWMKELSKYVTVDTNVYKELKDILLNL